MLNCRRRAGCALLIAVIFLFNGCRKSAETGTAMPPENPPAQPPVQAVNASAMPKSAERHHRMFMGGISPLIVSMSPDTIPFRDGHVPAARYSLTYEIDHPEKATKAYISIYARGVGEVQRFEVDVQPRGQIEFLLDASSFDLGPTVRFRAHCPFGTTDWFTMGADPQEFPQSPSDQQIGSVTPVYVNAPEEPCSRTVEFPSASGGCSSLENARPKRRWMVRPWN